MSKRPRSDSGSYSPDLLASQGSYGSVSSGRSIRGRKTVKKVTSAKSVKTKAGVKKIARDEFVRMAEKKSQTYDISLTPGILQSGTSQLQLSNNYIILNPSNSAGNGYTINRGTGNAQMIGNSVRTVKCMLKGILTQTLYNATNYPQPKPQLVRMFIYKKKQNGSLDPKIADLTNSTTGQFFEDGTAAVGFQGNLFDHVRMLNSDVFQYHAHYDFKLGPAIPQMGSAGTADNKTPLYTYSNNDFEFACRFSVDVTPFLYKTYTQDDNNAWDQNYTVCLFQVVAADNSGQSTSVNPVLCQAEVTYKYIDA